MKRRCRARVLQAARFLDVGVSPAALQSLSLIPRGGELRIWTLIAGLAPNHPRAASAAVLVICTDCGRGVAALQLGAALAGSEAFWVFPGLLVPQLVEFGEKPPTYAEQRLAHKKPDGKTGL